MTVNDTHANIRSGRSRHVPTTPSESAVHRAHPTPCDERRAESPPLEGRLLPAALRELPNL
jgi:hypothetical protein